tara:strand:- start:834 stop:1484 length:651 start_codon:yes stop_codon:yes gene_type:complete
MSWRDRLDELPSEQRSLLEGGSLSQRFSNRPLGQTHPALIGGFYGFLVAISLSLPIGYENGWSEETFRDWGFLAVLLMLLVAITGHVSLIVGKILRRPPISLPRAWIYPLPFIGLSILSTILVTDIESNFSKEIGTYLVYVGWLLLIAPGPIYIHLSWAPRWRLLCRLEEGLDPFDGDVPAPIMNVEDELDEDSDMELAIEDIEDDPPILHHDDEE